MKLHPMTDINELLKYDAAYPVERVSPKAVELDAPRPSKWDRVKAILKAER